MGVCLAKLYNNIEGYNVIFTPPSKKEVHKSTNIPCIFCEMAQGKPEVSKTVLYNDGKTMVVLNIFPFNRGHLLAIPVKHYTDFGEIDSKTLNNLFETVQKSTKLIKDVIKPDGINIGVNLGEIAGQRISHIHVHLVPRFIYETNFMGTTANTRVIRESLDETKARYMDKINILK
ncbi:MAG: HIT family protein [Methanobacterium sp.]